MLFAHHLLDVLSLHHPVIGRFVGLLLSDAVGRVHTDSRGTYGYRRVKAALQIESGLIVNHKLVASIMQELQLHGLQKRRTRRRNLIAVRTVSDLVNRNFTVTGPNQLWVTDIAEHPTKEGRVFACVVLDAFARKAVAHALNTRPRKTLGWMTPEEAFNEQLLLVQ